MKYRHALAATLLALFQASCSSVPGRTVRSASVSELADQPAGNQTSAVPVYSATVVATYPHDPHAFTQGIEFQGGYLYESTGIAGQSTLRKVKLETGGIVKSVALPTEYFGEGLTIFRGRIYQLTWLTKIGFVYDRDTFKRVGEFHYETEGWGLTHDEKSLIMSDGTNKLQFFEPTTFEMTRVLEVYAASEAVPNLNELEYIGGKIYANVWHSPRIAIIEPDKGKVTAWIDLSVLAAREQNGPEGVLNGIAYDHERHRLFVTGKKWAHVFEIRVLN